MAAAYQLRCQLFGHEQDVRAVIASVLPENGIISGSRDRTAKVWVPNENDNGYHEGHCVSGHTRYVSSVACMPPDDKYPHGLIFTGSNDSTILAFTLESPEPVYKLTGHSNNVCCLTTGKFGTLLSGSWDKTAKVWLKQNCVMTMEGHEEAVWAVAIMPEQGVMLTGSADKTIKVWKAGKCQNTIKGHEESVRALAVTQGNEFLSCSNDATVRRWLTTGDCLAVYYGHENFVYSIAVLPNGQDFVSSGEDRTVRVWKKGECVQTITHPTLSVWTVCTLSNGDIASGASDGTVRIFTSDPSRFASSDELKAYDDLIASSEVPSNLGDIKPEDLSEPEALLNPGTKDGQTKMIKTDSGKIELFSWDAGLSQWKKVGDVVGSAGGGSQASPGKTMFEGKEYDFVFSVDIAEGKPPLKLPYNASEDPWFAAQKFIHANELSQAFLDQVANFIIDNAKGVTLTQSTPAAYSDPFTGGNRYVPGSDSGTSTGGGVDPFTGSGRYVPGSGSSTGATGGADPFTGGGRYVPTYSETQRPAPQGGGDSKAGDPITGASSYTTSTVNPNLSKTNDFFPLQTLFTFDAANCKQIMGKLREFNENVDPNRKMEESKLNGIESMLNGTTPTEENLNTMKLLLEWPPNFVFPALDILRIGMKHQMVNQAFCAGKVVLDEMLKYWSGNYSVANQVLSLKVVCNMFAQLWGFKICMENRDAVIAAGLNLKNSKNRNVQIALCTIIMNYAVGLFGSLDLGGKSSVMAASSECLKEKPDGEAAFRLFVSMGTMIHKDESLQQLAVSLGVQSYLGEYLSVSDPKKVSECAAFLRDMLR